MRCRAIAVACVRLCLLLAAGLAPRAVGGAEVVVASKVFTESAILGEMAVQLLQQTGQGARHQAGLGGTRVLWSALLRGDIGCYPEYSGTLRAEIFAGESLESDAQLQQALARNRVWSSAPLGFNNTYVLGMKRERAQALGIATLSQLASHPDLRLGFSNEFLGRADGWPGLQAHYRLPQRDVRGLAHDLAYRGVQSDAIDITDLYSTDAEIVQYDLLALRDDAGFFPAYDALFICRNDVPKAARATLQRLSARIDAATMAAMNARASIEGTAEALIAADFLRAELGVNSTARVDGRARRVWQRTFEHLVMVGVSLGAAVLIAIPLGVLGFYRPRIGMMLFGTADVLQTVPALALLVFLIPVLGIGYVPAIAALFIYSVLPILRNTRSGLADIPAELRDSARALGLSAFAQLYHVELPLATRSILTGVRTAAVINVGTATLGALIGAGGYGQPILAGIRLDNTALILEGAMPAAALALAVQMLFEVLERVLVKVR